MKKKPIEVVKRLASILLLIFSSSVLADSTYDFAYTGRLADNTGKPIEGPITMGIGFYRQNIGGSALLTVTSGLESVPLQEGMFQIKVTMSAADYSLVFGDPSVPVYVEITDLTNYPSAPFPRQQVNMIPYAARVPVDNKTIGFNSDGKLAVMPFGSPTAGQFLTKDVNGNLVWATPSTSATSIQGQSISSSATPSSGQVLTYDGSQWVPGNMAGASGGTVTNVSGVVPLSVSNGTTTPSISMTQATGVSSGYLSSGDYLSFQSKENSISAGSTSQYFRGDKTWQTLNSDAVVEGASNQYFTAMRAQSAVVDNSISSGVINKAPSQDAVNTALGLKQNLVTSSSDLTSGSIATSKQPGVVLGPYGAATGNTGEIRFNELAANGTNYVALKAPDAIAGAAGTGVTWTLPPADGTSGQVLSTNGSNILSWVSPGVGSVTNVTATAPISVTNGSSTPSISMTVANGTTSGYLSSGDWTTFNNKVNTARQITAGTGLTGGGDLSADRSLSLNIASNTVLGGFKATTGKITLDGAGAITNIAADTATSAGNVTGIIAVANGGTGASLPASARSNLGAAASGANTDITSISGLTTALSTSQGGTGVSSTATYPSSGVIVTESATETLTNKTLTGTVINGASSIGGSTSVNTTGNITAASHISTAQSAFSLNPYGTTAGNTGEIRFNELAANGTNFVALKAPDAIAGAAGTGVTWTLPPADGTSGQVLSTNGSNLLSWISPSVGSVTNVTGTAPISVTNGSTTPSISMAVANGTTNGYLSSTDWTAFNNKVNTSRQITVGTGLTGGGDLSADRSISLNIASNTTIGGMKATTGKITLDGTGTITNIAADSAASIAGSNIVGVGNGGTGISSVALNGIPYGNGGAVALSVATGSANQILTLNGLGAPTFASIADTNISATAAITRSKIADGSANHVLINSGTGSLSSEAQLSLSRGGTGANLSATGGAGQVVKQTTVGGALTVATLTASDIPNLDASKITSGSLSASTIPWATPGAIGSTTRNTGDFTTLTTTGAVGIGTSSPGGTLEVKGTARMNLISSGTQTVTDGINQVGIIGSNRFSPVSNTTTTSAIGGWATFAPPSGVTITNGVMLMADGGGPNAGAGTITNGYGVYARIPSFATNNYSGYFEGNVGIGVTNPTEMLHVVGGNIRVDSSHGYIVTGTGQLNADGSGNLNLWSSGSNSITFGPGTTEKMRVTSSGNVGIGTTSPAAVVSTRKALVVADTTNDASVEVWGTLGARAQMESVGGDSYVGSAAKGTGNGNMNLTYANGAIGLTMLGSNGNVGIGTSNPTANLDVNGVGSTAGEIALQLRSGNGSASFASGQISFGYNGTDTYRHSIRSRHNSATYAGNALDFYLWQYGVDTSTTMGSKHVLTLDGNGYVGIHTTSPVASLDVVGQAYLHDGMDNGVIYWPVSKAFYLRSGDPQGAYSERMYISPNGDMGIGTTSPGGRLSVNGATGTSIYIQPTSTANHVVLRPPANDGTVGFGVTNTANTAWMAYMLNNGTVGYSSLSSLSDGRLKEDIHILEPGLNELIELRPVQYFWKNKDVSKEQQIGFIAQEVETVFPQLVSEGPDGYKRVNYVNLVPVIVKAAQELKKENDQLKSELSELKILVCLDHPEAKICQK